MQKDLVVKGDFKDYFSAQSDSYAKYRPTYPENLFQHLSRVVDDHEIAWDCGTGSGQAAVALAGFFENVIATDASESQIDASVAHPGVVYRTATAEDSKLPSDSVDLVTVAQAFHWFDDSAFLREAQRVLRPRGVLAIWCYEICTIDQSCDEIIDRLYTDIVGEFWPPERVKIERGYDHLMLPGEKLDVPDFEIAQNWCVAEQLGYLRTWSACNRYKAMHNTDPVSKIATDLEIAWGPGERRVVWPIKLAACRPNFSPDTPPDTLPIRLIQ